jgi:uracil-DNA glycosylase family 4
MIKSKMHRNGRKFNIDCKRCKRLSRFLKDIKVEYPDYHCAPVAPFGPDDARLLIVGLAPGMHGANATGRPFTGDHAGLLLYSMLFEYGFSNQPFSENSDDNLKLENCRITNAVKCLPPANKPMGEEVSNCSDYLVDDIIKVPEGGVILALGKIAHDAVIKALKLRLVDFKFNHGNLHLLEGRSLTLVDSYHCSRYNTQTKRLTTLMFSNIFKSVLTVFKGRTSDG